MASEATRSRLQTVGNFMAATGVILSLLFGSQAYHLIVLRYDQGRLGLFSVGIPNLRQKLMSPSRMCVEYDDGSRGVLSTPGRHWS